MNTVLVVEDDLVYRGALARALTRSGYAVREAGGVEEALARLDDGAPTHAVIDLALPDGSGIDVLRAVVDAAPACRAVLLTGHGTIPATVEAMRAGAVDVKTKPVSTAVLVAALERPAAAVRAAADVLDHVERDHIRRVLEAVDGNISEAARRLGVHRRTLQRRLRRLPDEA
ncbi:MAG: response regulator [Alphaproteobacteria bacterium]|nr:response regulator [Alphaproteobacteria bacterium]